MKNVVLSEKKGEACFDCPRWHLPYCFAPTDGDIAIEMLLMDSHLLQLHTRADMEPLSMCRPYRF